MSDSDSLVGECKGNYNSYHSPIRKPKFEAFQSPSRSSYLQSPCKDSQPVSATSSSSEDPQELLHFNLTVPESYTDVLSKLRDNVEYLKTLSVEPIDYKSIKDADPSNVIVEHYHLVRQVNDLNQAIVLRNFKFDVILNNCMQMLDKLGSSVSNDDDSLSFDSSVA